MITRPWLCSFRWCLFTSIALTEYIGSCTSWLCVCAHTFDYTPIPRHRFVLPLQRIGWWAPTLVSGPSCTHVCQHSSHHVLVSAPRTGATASAVDNGGAAATAPPELPRQLQREYDVSRARTVTVDEVSGGLCSSCACRCLPV